MQKGLVLSLEVADPDQMSFGHDLGNRFWHNTRMLMCPEPLEMRVSAIGAGDAFDFWRNGWSTFVKIPLEVSEERDKLFVVREDSSSRFLEQDGVADFINEKDISLRSWIAEDLHLR